MDDNAQNNDFIQAALPALQALARLYGPMQQKQGDQTVMYHCNGADLTVRDVRTAIQALGILVQDEPHIHAKHELTPLAQKVLNDGSR